jgi:hypothetical protein
MHESPAPGRWPGKILAKKEIIARYYFPKKMHDTIRYARGLVQVYNIRLNVTFFSDGATGFLQQSSPFLARSLSPTPTSPMRRRSATWSPPAGTNARRWHAPTMVEGRRFGPGPRRWKGRCKGEATTARETGAEPGRGWEGPGKFPLIFWNLKILTSLAPLSFKKSTYWLRLWRESHVEFGGGDIPEI